MIPHSIFWKFPLTWSGIFESKMFFLRFSILSAYTENTRKVLNVYREFAESIYLYSKNTRKVFKGTQE
jgi:hypothetical protein